MFLMLLLCPKLHIQQLLGEDLPRLQRCNSIQIFLKRVKRWRITTEDTSIVHVLDHVDYNLFNKSQYSNHCLRHLQLV